MDQNIGDNANSIPPTYDETVRNRKRSTITVTQEQKLYLQKEPEKELQECGKSAKSETKNEKNILADINVPKDPFWVVFIAVVLLGLVHQLPFTFFGAANEYWMYKFRNVTLNTTDANKRTYLQINFSALLGMIGAIPTVISNFIVTFIAHNIKARTRIMVTILVHTVIFIIHDILININTDSWQEEFFYITMVTIIIVRCTLSFGAAGQYALITRLHPMYLKVYILGGGIAEFFNSAMRLLSVSISPSPTVSALIYFGLATFLLLTTTIVTYISSYTSFFRYYESHLQEEKKPKFRSTSDIFEVIKYLWPIMLLYVLQLCIPTGSVSTLVVSEHYGEQGNVWANQYFITVCSYLIPAFMNVVGRAVYNKLDWNWSMPAMFVLVIFYQIINTTTIYLSNALPRKHLPVLFKHDWEYALAMAVHGLSIGFITSMTNIKTVRIVPKEKTELALMLLYFFNSIISSAFSPLGMVAVRLI